MGLLLKRTKAWWAKKIAREGEGVEIGAGSPVNNTLTVIEEVIRKVDKKWRERVEREYDFFGGGVSQRDVTKNGDLMTLDDWLKQVNGGGFIDYDGHGVYAFQRADGPWLTSNMMVKPSDITKFQINPPKWATHVLWFNR